MLHKVLIGILIMAGIFLVYSLFAGSKAMASEGPASGRSPTPDNKWSNFVGPQGQSTSSGGPSRFTLTPNIHIGTALASSKKTGFSMGNIPGVLKHG